MVAVMMFICHTKEVYFLTANCQILKSSLFADVKQTE